VQERTRILAILVNSSEDACDDHSSEKELTLELCNVEYFSESIILNQLVSEITFI